MQAGEVKRKQNHKQSSIIPVLGEILFLKFYKAFQEGE